MDRQLLRKYLGQRLSVGFDGPVIPEEYARLIREYKVGNVILFRRNVASVGQLQQLCADLRELILRETGLEPFIMIDEECGSVSRLAHITAQTPCAMAIGATDDPENAYRIGRLIGTQLMTLGINFNLAPVLDCFTNPDNMVCGNRCFAADPEKTARFGRAYIRGLREAGVIACGKHFPGHGDTAVDSHLALPIVNKSLEEMRRNELVPFAAAISEGIEAIMSAHVVFPAVDPARVPSTVSKAVMTGLLREEMGFDGLIVSDGMEMNAVMALYGVEDGVLRTLNAGVDIALVCHSAAQVVSTISHIEAAYAEGAISEENLTRSFERIAGAKQKLPPLSETDGRPLVTGAQRAALQEIMTASVRLLHCPQGQPLPKVDAETAVFGTPARQNALVNDDLPLDAAAVFARATGARYLAEAPQTVPGKAVVFLGRHPDAPKVIEAVGRLAETGAQVTAIALYTPRMLDTLPDTVWKICAWQYDELAVNALVRYCKGSEQA